jgi:hypothetical protein
VIVIGEIEAGLDAPGANPNQIPVLLDQRRIAQNETGHAIAGAAHSGQVGECRAEIKAAAAAIHPVFGELAPADVAAELPGILAGSEGDVIQVLKRIGAAQNGHRPAGADARKVGWRDDGQRGLEGAGISVRYSQRISQVEAGLGAFGKIGDYIAVEAGAKLVDQPR